MFLKVILPIIVCFIPLIAGFFIFLFSLKSKPLQLLFSILLGLVAVFPISVIQFFLPETNLLSAYPILRSLIKSIVLYGFIEEAIKCALIIPLPKKDKTIQQFLWLSFTFGLALGCFESVVYYLDHLQIAVNRGAELLYGSIFLRIFSADIIHMCCAGLCGIFVFSIFSKKVQISALIWAILLHGCYDFFAGFQNGLKWFAIPVILLSIAECRIKLMQQISSDSFSQ